MVTAPLWISKKVNLLEQLQDFLDGFNVALAFIFSINQDIIWVEKDKDFSFFYQNLDNVFLEIS